MEADRKRLDKIESSLTPREIVALWVQEIAKFDSMQQYISWQAENLSRAPLAKMLQQLKDRMLRRSGDWSEIEYRKLLRKRASEVLFLYYLVHKANDHVRECVDRERLRMAAMTARVHATIEHVCSAGAMFKIWCTLHYVPYPLDTETAAAVLAVLQNHVTSISDLLDHLTYQFESEGMASGPVCEQLKRAIQSLCRRDLVKRGSCVRLGSSSVEFLASPPLVDQEWIDSKAVEFAEYVALLREKGIDLEAVDSHLLAPLRPCRRKAEKADVLSEAEVGFIRNETITRLSNFPGRTKEIDGQRYLHVDDYRSWGERKTLGDLQIIDGIVTQSWNAWIEANGSEPELAGIPVSKLDVFVNHMDFFSCDDPEAQRRRQATVSLTRMSLPDRMEASQISHFLDECRITIPNLLVEVRSVIAAMAQIASGYFQGLEIIFKSDADALKKLAEASAVLIDDYNCLVDMIKTDESAIVFGAKMAERVQKIDRSSESAVGKMTTDLVRKLVDLANVEMLGYFNETERATEIVKSILRGERGQAG